MIKQNPTYAAHPQPANVTDGRDYSHSNLSKAQLDLAKPIGQIGEVYLFDSTYTLIDSTCIGDLVEYEYKFTGLSNGTYYVKVKVVYNEYCPYSLSLTPLEQDDSTEVVISGSNGNANLYADIECFTRTSCE